MSKSATSRSRTAPEEPSYERALEELEQARCRHGGQQLPLDQLLESYRRGAELLGICRAKLAAVEQQVKVLDEGELKSWQGD